MIGKPTLIAVSADAPNGMANPSVASAKNVKRRNMLILPLGGCSPVSYEPSAGVFQNLAIIYRRSR